MRSTYWRDCSDYECVRSMGGTGTGVVRSMGGTGTGIVRDTYWRDWSDYECVRWGGVLAL